MIKKIIPVILIIALLGGTGYYLNKKKTNSVITGDQTTKQSMSEASEFAKAIESGKPTFCTMTKDSDSMSYHIKGKMMAADITTMVEGKTVVSHMINDAGYLYMWQDGTKQGTKMAIPTDEEIKSMSDKAKSYQNTTPNLADESDYDSYKDQGYTINCKPDNASTDFFTPPSDITFIDPSAMMKEVTAPGSTGAIDMKKLEELQKQYGSEE